MDFDKLTFQEKLFFSLKLAEEQSKLGKDTSFKNWWFFDTNCLSELIKIYRQGHEEKVLSFLDNKDLLLLSTSFQEIRKRPDLLEGLEGTLSSARTYLVSDVTRFWYADIFNFLNVDGIAFNSLETYPLKSGFIELLLNSDEFEEVSSSSEEQIRKWFFQQIEGDIGASLDERDLCIVIWHRINEYSQEFYNLEIPIANGHALNFPAFFVFYYTYFFRYIKNESAVPEINDFIDLTNAIAAPYCSHYYSEQKFTTILRNFVQGRQPPSPWNLIKKVYKRGAITKDVYEDARTKRKQLDRKSRLLPGTKIYNFSEMRRQVLGE
jgi:hypothetical protein